MKRSLKERIIHAISLCDNFILFLSIRVPKGGGKWESEENIRNNSNMVLYSVIQYYFICLRGVSWMYFIHESWKSLKSRFERSPYKSRAPVLFTSFIVKIFYLFTRSLVFTRKGHTQKQSMITFINATTSKFFDRFVNRTNFWQEACSNEMYFAQGKWGIWNTLHAYL